MQTTELMQMVIEHTREIAALTASAKSAHKRIDDNDKIIAGIHELAKNVAMMAAEIKLLTARVDKSIERIEQGQKTQGERIGSIEQSIQQIERNEAMLMKHADKLEAIETAPAKKWNKFVWLIIVGVATAIIAYIMGKFL